jgi:hypothetical protein
LTNLTSGIYLPRRHVKEDEMNVEFWIEFLIVVLKIVAAGCCE